MYAIILLSTAVTVSSQLVEFVAFAAVLALVTWIMLRLYLPTATKIKAIVSDTAGSLVGLTAESLEGPEVIQAYQHEEYFVNVCSTCHPLPICCPPPAPTYLIVQF